MQRIDLPGLAAFADREANGYYELGYATGHEVYAFARLRVIPSRPVEMPTQTVPNAPVAPDRIAVFLRASLVDGEGRVLRLGGELLLGEEQFAGWQFTGKPFDPVAWLDESAAKAINFSISKAETLAVAIEHGFVVPASGGPSGSSASGPQGNDLITEALAAG